MKICNGECCGCGLCAALCPTKAIVMRSDAEGFLMPEINEDLCCNCSLCQKSCPVNQAQVKEVENKAEMHCYYAISADETFVGTASSGGVFPTLARQILTRGGAVVGAAFDEQFAVKLSIAENENDLKSLLQAKYVQSEIPIELFDTVLQILKQGRNVLFSGTPCQIAAFKSFLKGREYENLLCVEVICNSVPSPGVWQSYLRHVVEKTGSPIKSVAFRDKSLGWHKFSLVVDCGEIKVAKMHKFSPYMQLFLQGLISRKSCAVCPFKSGRSGADISLGDFWKLHKIKPELNNSTGVSMVITHSPAGEIALRACEFSAFQEFPMATVQVSNPRFFTSLIPNRNRDKFFEKFAARNGQYFAPDEFLKKSSKRNFLQKLFGFFHSSK